MRILPIGTEKITAVLPDKHPLIAQPTVSVEALGREPLVLLSTAVDPVRTNLEQTLQRSRMSSFRIVEAESLPELFDYVVLSRRCSLVRASTTRFMRDGVAFKSISDSPSSNLALVLRSDDRRATALSLLDAVTAFCSQDRS